MEKLVKAHSTHTEELRCAIKDLSLQLEKVRDSLQPATGGAEGEEERMEGGRESSATIVARAQSLVEEVWKAAAAALKEGAGSRSGCKACRHTR